MSQGTKSLSIYINLCYLIIQCVSINIEWESWINLPISNAQMLTTMYNGDIVVLGGRNCDKNSSKVYRVNASLIDTKSESNKWISQEIEGNYIPGPIEIKNDNYLTIDTNTYIFGPTIDNKNAIYQFNHEYNK